MLLTLLVFLLSFSCVFSLCILSPLLWHAIQKRKYDNFYINRLPLTGYDHSNDRLTGYDHSNDVRNPCCPYINFLNSDTQTSAKTWILPQTKCLLHPKTSKENDSWHHVDWPWKTYILFFVKCKHRNKRYIAILLSDKYCKSTDEYNQNSWENLKRESHLQLSG